MNLTCEEYKQLDAIKVLYPDIKYIARDTSGMVWGYKQMAFRGEYAFFNDDSVSEYRYFCENILPSLTWESEPLNIDEALEGRRCDKWINLHDTDEWYGGLYKCPVCEDVNIGVSNYCPNCGRRLEVDND